MTANPTLLSMPLAQNGQKNVIPATQATAGDGLFSQSTGFPAETSLPLGAGGKAPTREDFNGMANLLGGVAYYAQKGWIFQFDAGQEYFAGCIVRDTTDGKLYECLDDVAAGGSVPSADSVNWKAFSTGSGLPVGFIAPYAGTGLAEGWLDCDGSAVSRTMYPDLFAAIGTTWGAGDGSTTFNLPRSEDLVLQGASALNPVGTYLQAGLPNIEGSLTYLVSTTSISGTGAITGAAGSGRNAGAGSSLATGSSFTFDASHSNPIYGASDTVQSPAACVRFMIKAFDGQTPDSALIDITQYASDLANKATRALDNLTQDGEDHFLKNDYTIIYPNGGTEANPAIAGVRTRFVENNPFPGYYVRCVAEVKYNNVWGESPFISTYMSGGNNGCGINATQLDDSTIIVQTGDYSILRLSQIQGNPFNITADSAISNLPCRVKVWKIGKVSA